jgi:hypothetical protein
MDLARSLLICPCNDGESAAILDIGRKVGLNARQSRQPWGARLEAEPESTFQDLPDNIIIVEIPGPAKEEELSKNHRLFIIDHHRYGDLDRFNRRSSLEQFADLIGYSLNRWERGIALNDRGYIDALRKDGYSMEEIHRIRRFDLVAQGYSAGDFELLKEDYAKGYTLGEHFFVVETASPRTSYLADIHYWAQDGTGASFGLLVLRMNADGFSTAVSFNGNPAVAKRLFRVLKGYCGGDETSSMYWGKSLSPAEMPVKLLGAINQTLAE